MPMMRVLEGKLQLGVVVDIMDEGNNGVQRLLLVVLSGSRLRPGVAVSLDQCQAWSRRALEVHLPTVPLLQ